MNKNRNRNKKNNTSNKPIVSLIIPVFNTEMYLKKCLDSSMNQTLKNLEIIVINDGSQDGSLEIAESYAKKDKRIKVFSQKNRGQGYARNLGIRKAKGEFIFCLDADDWIELDTLEKLYKKAQIEKSDVVICGWKRIEEDSGKTIATRVDIHNLKDTSKEGILRRVFSGNMNLMACACLMNKSIFDENHIIYPDVYHEDLYVMPKIYYFAKKISIEKENLYNWLVRAKSTTNSANMKHVVGVCGAIYDWKIFLHKENIHKKYKNEFVIACFAYLNSLLKQIDLYQDAQGQKESYDFIIETLLSVHELKDYQTILPENQKKTRENILTLYQKVLDTHNSIENNYELLKKEYSHINSELDEIKASRGYRYLSKYYGHRSKISKIISKRSARKKVADVPSDTLNQSKTTEYDVVFLPHKDYQVWTMGLIARELKKLGLTSCIMDLTDYYKDEGSREAAKKFPDIPFKDLSVLLDNKISSRTLVCMNDWDKKVNRPLIQEAQKNNIKTIGIIEGINDFYDKDIKWERHAYQTVEYLLMTGEHDRQFFQNKKDKAVVVGIPRLKELIEEKVIFPQKPLAVINVNFSYGVLEDKRDMWIASAVEGCTKAGIDYVITKHPADKGDYSNYKVGTENMYDLVRKGSIIISRFGSIIIEALAMGKPAIYHNPHNEQVFKFQEPMGAYSLSNDSDGLAEAIKFELSLEADYRQRANEFLDLHCNTHDKKSSATLSAEKIKKIIKSQDA